MDEFKHDDYIKILREDSILIQVMKIKWKGPHEFDSIWKTFKVLPANTPEQEIEKIIKKLHYNRTYFGKCKICQRKMLAGFMMGDICHGCMSNKYGIVF